MEIEKASASPAAPARTPRRSGDDGSDPVGDAPAAPIDFGLLLHDLHWL